MPGQPIDVQFPIAGVNRGVGFQAESPFACDDALNCWPKDVFEERMRGGSRPGLRKAFPSGVTGPVHLLSNLRVIEGTAGSTQTQLVDSFEGTQFGGQWSQATWIMPPVGGELKVTEGYAYVDSELSAPDDGRVLVDIEQTIDDAAKPYTISLEVRNTLSTPAPGAPDNGIGSKLGVYTIFARMNTTAPNGTLNGVIARVDPTNSLLRLASYIDGVYSETVSAIGNPLGPVNLQLLVSANSCTATYGTTSINATLSSANFGRRMGFEISYSAGSPSFFRHRVGAFSVAYYGSAALPNRNVVVAVGGTNAAAGSTVELKYEDSPGSLVVPTVNAETNPAHRQLVAAEMLGKLYIVGEDAEGVWVFDATSGQLSDVAASPADPAVSGPPYNCYAIVSWRSRLGVVTRDDQYNMAFSRVGDPTDWVYSGTSVGAAVRLNTSGIDTGRLAEPITCPIAHSDDYLVMGCHSSLFVLRGDPTYQGQIDRLSNKVGILSPTAYTYGPNGETIFMSFDGIYGIPAGVMAYPESVSREKLPREMRDIDTDQNRVLMAYDVRNRGIFIGITPNMGSGGTYFWFDWQTRGFWPMSFNSGHEPTAITYRTADSSLDQRLILGCRDGHIRSFDNLVVDDDGVSFSYNVLLGPFQLGGSGYFDGMLNEIVGQLGTGSGDATLEVMGGNCIEAARRASPTFSCKLQAGKNITHRPRLRFNACYLRISGTPPFAMENLTLVRERLGKQRL